MVDAGAQGDAGGDDVGWGAGRRGRLPAVPPAAAAAAADRPGQAGSVRTFPRRSRLVVGVVGISRSIGNGFHYGFLHVAHAAQRRITGRRRRAQSCARRSTRTGIPRTRNRVLATDSRDGAGPGARLALGCPPAAAAVIGCAYGCCGGARENERRASPGRIDDAAVCPRRGIRGEARPTSRERETSMLSSLVRSRYRSRGETSSR